MADEAKPVPLGTAEGASVTPFIEEDFAVSKNKSMPLSDTSDMNTFGGNFQAAPMVVPERITVNGDFDSKVEGHEDKLTRDLQGNAVSFETYMGGMVTPPRTLTVDDTAFNFGGQTREKNNEEMYAANENNRLEIC